jgi:hypothetical protein
MIDIFFNVLILLVLYTIMSCEVWNSSIFGMNKMRFEIKIKNFNLKFHLIL